MISADQSLTQFIWVSNDSNETNETNETNDCNDQSVKWEVRQVSSFDSDVFYLWKHVKIIKFRLFVYFAKELLISSFSF